MSRSFRFPAYYICMGATPDVGKRYASRSIRHQARHLCHAVLQKTQVRVWEEHREEFVVHVDHPQDKTRGSAGSRSKDYGWNYFGDGRKRLFAQRLEPREHLPDVNGDISYARRRREIARKLCRK